MKYVLTYYPTDNFAALAREHFPGHRARLGEFHGRGTLLMAGALDEPPSGEALALFTSPEAAEEFVAGDPFVLNGVVGRWTIRPWREVLAP